MIKSTNLSNVQSYEDWRQSLYNEFGINNIHFRETGADGWDRLDFKDGKPVLIQHKGPHYTDAIPCGDNPLCNSGKLVGTYNFNTKIGKQFFYIEQVEESK